MHPLPLSSKRFAHSISERSEGEKVSSLSVGLNVFSCFVLFFLWGLSAHCNKQVSLPFRYHLKNSLFAVIAFSTGPSATLTACFLPLSACLSVSRLACLSRLEMAVNRIKCSETYALKMLECRSAFWQWFGTFCFIYIMQSALMFQPKCFGLVKMNVWVFVNFVGLYYHHLFCLLQRL